MMEALELLGNIWSNLTREQRQGVIILSTSFPLGLLSVGIGVFSGSLSLLLVGLATLAIGAYAIVHIGLVLFRLFVFLIGFVLKLPFVLLGIAKDYSNKKSDILAELGDGRGGSSDSAPKKLQLQKVDRESPDSLPVGWFDFVFLVWGILAVVQIRTLHGFFFGV